MLRALRLTCLLIASCVLAHAAAETPAAPLAITPLPVDFGRMAQQSTDTRTVTLRNTGQAPLEIFSVSADCGCTTSQLRESLLTPGQSTELTVTFESRNYSGKVTRTLHLATSAGTRELLVEAQVSPYKNWEILPGIVMVPTSVVGETAHTELSVQPVQAGAHLVTAVKTDMPWLTAELLPATGGLPQRVKLTKLPGAPIGTLSSLVTLVTNDPETPSLTANIVVPVRSTLRFAPAPIVFPRVKVGEETRTTIRLIGWTHPDAPRVVVSPGTLTPLPAAENGEPQFELRVTPAKAATQIVKIQVFHGDVLMLEHSAVARVLREN